MATRMADLGPRPGSRASCSTSAFSGSGILWSILPRLGGQKIGGGGPFFRKAPSVAVDARKPRRRVNGYGPFGGSHPVVLPSPKPPPLLPKTFDVIESLFRVLLRERRLVRGRIGWGKGRPQGRDNPPSTVGRRATGSPPRAKRMSFAPPRPKNAKALGGRGGGFWGG